MSEEEGRDILIQVNYNSNFKNILKDEHVYDADMHIWCHPIPGFSKTNRRKGRMGFIGKIPSRRFVSMCLKCFNMLLL